MWPKIKTALVVILLSGLIWVFAEREVIKTATVEVEIYLSKERQDLFLQYVVSEKPSAVESQRVELEVQGPAARIQDIKDGTLKARAVPLGVGNLGYTRTGEIVTFTVRVLDLLKEKVSFEGSDTTLTVTDAKPLVLKVMITPLTLSPVEFKVYDELNKELIPELLEPQRDDAYIPGHTTVQAKVILNAQEQLQAMSEPITVFAKVPSPGQPSEIQVKLKLPKGGAVLPVYTIQPQRIGVGIVKPVSLEGRFEVVIENLDEVRRAYGPIEFRGAAAARTAYQDSKYHLLLEVREDDLTSPNPARPLRYLLPEGQGELEIINKKRDAVRFKVVPVKPIE